MPTNTINPNTDFLSGGGEVGAMLRSRDWSNSLLGHPTAWPPALQTAVSLMLGAAQPVYIAWGPELASLYNDAYLPIVGSKHSGIDLPFKVLWSEIWEEYRPIVEKTLTGEAQHFVDRPIALAGREGIPLGYFTFSYTALRDEDGRVAGFYCAATETTDKVLAESALRRSEALFRGMFQDSPAPFLILATDAPRFTITEVNESYLLATNSAREQLIGRGVFDAFPDAIANNNAEGVRKLRASLIRVIESGVTDNLLLRYDISGQCGSYEERWWRAVNTPLLNNQGKVESIIHHALDVTDKHQAEVRLQASETRLRGVLDCMAEGAALLASDFTILELNPEAMRLESRSRDAIVGRSHWEAYPGSENSEIGRIYKQAMTERVPVTLEHRYEWEDGRIAWLDMRAYPTPEGGLAVFYRDVTARRLVEESLRASEERQRFLLTLNDNVRTISDPFKVIAATTQALGKWLGVSRVVYAEIDEGTATASTSGDWTDGSVPHLPEQVRLADYGTHLIDKLRNGDTLRIGDVHTHEVTAGSIAAMDAIGIRALVSVPLVKDGRFIANINVHQNSPRVWTDSEVELIQAVAERTWESLERARTAAELHAREARHRATLEIETVGVVYFDLQGIVIEANDAFLDMAGRTRDELRRAQFSDVNGNTPPWSWHEQQAISDLINVGHRGPRERKYVRHDGARRFFMCASRMLDKQTAVEFVIDITERKVAEAALRETEERLRLAVDNAEVGFWDVDLINDALIWPARTKAMFGISPAEHVTMRDFYDGLHPDDRSATSEMYAAAADPERRALYDTEYRTIGKEDGIIRWVAAKGRGIFDANGRCVRVTGTAIDITARKASDAALRASEARFEAIANSVDPMIWTSTADGVHDYWNVRWHEFTGAPLSMDANRWSELIHPLDRDRVLDAWQHCVETMQPYHIEFRLRHYSGGHRWVIARAQCESSDRSQPSRWFGTFTDIHEIVLARDVLARSRQELERLIDERTAERDRMWDTSPDLMMIIDFQGVFQRANPAWRTLLGYNHDEIVGRHVNEFVVPDDHSLTIDAYKTAASGSHLSVENRYLHRDGSIRWISWVAAPANGVAYATGRDVTIAKAKQIELESAQEAMRQSQKMEAVGQLTGGIAHDFNNMLAVVMGSLELLGRRIASDDPRVKRHLDAANNGARRAAQLTKRLLAFSRQQPLRPEAVNVNKLVAGMSELLGHSLGGTVQLLTRLHEELWLTYIDQNQLENVLLNLAVNARDAMPDGGKLTVETTNSYLDTHHVLGHGQLRSGPYVLITVTDTGTGMSEDVMAKAFDPFFTTKEIGKGTGLGLSQVYGFVKQSNGHIKINSQLGEGTTFEIYLPRFAGPASDCVVDSKHEDLALARAPELILVVEDEALVRQFSVDALVDLGYRVVEADGASKALQLIQSHPDIALMFTDIVMPDINGARLAEEAKRIRADLPILFTTGYARNALATDGVVEPGIELLLKPFTVDELAARVREILDSHASTRS